MFMFGKVTIALNLHWLVSSSITFKNPGFMGAWNTIFKELVLIKLVVRNYNECMYTGRDKKEIERYNFSFLIIQ